LDGIWENIKAKIVVGQYLVVFEMPEEWILNVGNPKRM